MNEDRSISEVIGELLGGVAGRMEDVAQEAGVSYSALYSWATGRRRPGRENVEKLAQLAETRASRLEGLAGSLRVWLEEGGERARGGR